MEKFLARLRQYADRPWYLPLVCLLAFADLFVMLIPTEGMIVTTSFVRPKGWWVTAIAVALSTTLAVLLVAWLGSHYGESFAIWLLGEKVFESAMWIRADHWIQRYGFWGLWFISLGPIPPQPAILLCALGHMPGAEIGSAFFLARLPKYLLFSFLATRGPKFFKQAFGDETINVDFTWANLKKVLRRYFKKAPPKD